MSGRRLGLAIAIAAIAAIAAIGVQRLGFFGLGTFAFQRGTQRLIDRAEQIRAQARPDYQQAVLEALPQNPLTGSYRRLDDGLADARVVAAHAGEDRQDDAVLLAFDFSDDTQLPSTATNAPDSETEDGILRLRTTPQTLLSHPAPIAVPRDEIGLIEVRARVQRGPQMGLYWNSEWEPENPWKHGLRIDLVPDGEFHVYAINARHALKRGTEAGGTIRRLIVQPSTADEDQVEIDYVRLLGKLADYRSATHGVGHETLDREMRRAIYASVPVTLEYRLELPAEEPKLDFGIGMLREGDPVRFEVAIAGESGEDASLFSKRLADADRWLDTKLDLSGWAGRSVLLRLSVDGFEDNVAFWSRPVVYGRPARRLNVVMYLEDALRGDRLSYAGHFRETSPVKDALAREGIVFLNAFSQATKTRPSVPSFMTSLPPTATGVWSFYDRLDESYVTLAEVLQRQGFATGSFVQNGNAGPWAGLHQGFDSIVDHELLGKRSEAAVGDRVTAWLERHADRNFFLYIHLVDPHGPYDPPPPYDRWYRETPSDRDPQQRRDDLDPEWVKEPTKQGRGLLYDGEVQHNDGVFGRFVESLKDLGVYENTLLIFLSDHGEYLGEQGRWEHVPPGLTPVVRVPLMMVHPDRLPGNVRVDETVQLMDVMPTVLELAQVETSDLALAGDSLVGLIEGRDSAFWQDRVTISEEPTTMQKGEPCDCGSLFFRNWQLIDSLANLPAGDPEDRRLRLLRFDEDPAESRPVEDVEPGEIVKRRFADVISDWQTNHMEAWRRFTGGAGELVRLDPGVQEHLRALGYLE